MRAMKLAVGVLLVFAVASGAHAQAALSDAHAQSVGVKGGWAHSTVAGSGDGGTGGVNTFAGGAFLEVAVTPLLAFQGEVLSVPKGAGEESGTVKTRLIVHYVEVPLLAKVALPLRGSALKPNLFAGPYLAFRGGCSLAYSGVGTGGSTLNCGDSHSGFSDTDVGATFGGGVAFPLAGRVDGLLEARYDLGLKTVNRSSAGSALKNRAVLLLAGLSLPLHPRGRGTARRAR